MAELMKLLKELVKEMAGIHLALRDLVELKKKGNG